MADKGKAAKPEMMIGTYAIDQICRVDGTSPPAVRVLGSGVDPNADIYGYVMINGMGVGFGQTKSDSQGKYILDINLTVTPNDSDELLFYIAGGGPIPGSASRRWDSIPDC